MSKERQREIAAMGGSAAHAQGAAQKFTSAEARIAGQLGGQAVARTYGHDYMVQLGQAGGNARNAALLERRELEARAHDQADERKRCDQRVNQAIAALRRKRDAVGVQS